MYFRKKENDPRIKTWAVRRNFDKNTNEDLKKGQVQGCVLTTLVKSEQSWTENNTECVRFKAKHAYMLLDVQIVTVGLLEAILEVPFRWGWGEASITQKWMGLDTQPYWALISGGLPWHFRLILSSTNSPGPLK